MAGGSATKRMISVEHQLRLKTAAFLRTSSRSWPFGEKTPSALANGERGPPGGEGGEEGDIDDSGGATCTWLINESHDGVFHCSNTEG